MTWEGQVSGHPHTVLAQAGPGRAWISPGQAGGEWGAGRLPDTRKSGGTGPGVHPVSGQGACRSLVWAEAGTVWGKLSGQPRLHKPCSHPNLDGESGWVRRTLFPLAHGILLNELKLDSVYTLAKAGAQQSPPEVVPGGLHAGLVGELGVPRKDGVTRVDVAGRLASPCCRSLGESLNLSEPGFSSNRDQAGPAGQGLER